MEVQCGNVTTTQLRRTIKTKDRSNMAEMFSQVVHELLAIVRVRLNTQVFVLDQFIICNICIVCRGEITGYLFIFCVQCVEHLQRALILPLWRFLPPFRWFPSFVSRFQMEELLCDCALTRCLCRSTETWFRCRSAIYRSLTTATVGKASTYTEPDRVLRWDIWPILPWWPAVRVRVDWLMELFFIWRCWAVA